MRRENKSSNLIENSWSLISEHVKYYKNPTILCSLSINEMKNATDYINSRLDQAEVTICEIEVI